MSAGAPATKSCGPCNLCCQVLDIPVLAKPSGTLCRHASGGGCGIYPDRPHDCRAFVCGWLAWDFLGEAWRPSTAHFLIRSEPDRGVLCIDVDPAYPSAWREPAYYPTIKSWSARIRRQRGCVLVYAGPTCTVVFPEQDMEIGLVRPEDELVVGNQKGRDYVRRLVRLRRDGVQVGEWKGAKVPLPPADAKPA